MLKIQMYHEVIAKNDALTATLKRRSSHAIHNTKLLVVNSITFLFILTQTVIVCMGFQTVGVEIGRPLHSCIRPQSNLRKTLAEFRSIEARESEHLLEMSLQETSLNNGKTLMISSLF